MFLNNPLFAASIFPWTSPRGQCKDNPPAAVCQTEYPHSGCPGSKVMQIAREEWGRCEYEMCVGEKFTPEVHDILKEIDKFNTLEELKEELEKLDKRTARLKGTDCYEQCNKNMPMIVRECIWQYKEQKKAKDGE